MQKLYEINYKVMKICLKNLVDFKRGCIFIVYSFTQQPTDELLRFFRQLARVLEGLESEEGELLIDFLKPLGRLLLDNAASKRFIDRLPRFSFRHRLKNMVES